MAEPLRDARLDELAFLTELARLQGEQGQGWTMRQFPEDNPTRRMVVQLLLEGCINDAGSVHWHYARDEQGRQKLVDEINDRKLMALSGILSGQQTSITLGHRGRVRIAELAQALASGRQRDPTGAVWSKRHLMTDLEVAIRRSTQESPAALAILDMNGLKQINDSGGHDLGDRAIRAYLQTIAATLPTGFDAYRGDGGDEVFVVAQAGQAPLAAETLEAVLRHIGAQRVEGVAHLRASCGVVISTGPGESPTDLNKRADETMYRAKALARKHEGKASVMAVADHVAVVVPAG